MQERAAEGRSRPRKRKAIDERIEELKAKLKAMEHRQVLKERKKTPAFHQMLKLRKALVKAVDAFDQDKDTVPLEVLSLSKRLIHAINSAEEEERLRLEELEQQEAPEEDPAPQEFRRLFD